MLKRGNIYISFILLFRLFRYTYETFQICGQTNPNLEVDFLLKSCRGKGVISYTQFPFLYSSSFPPCPSPPPHILSQFLMFINRVDFYHTWPSSASVCLFKSIFSISCANPLLFFCLSDCWSPNIWCKQECCRCSSKDTGDAGGLIV